MPQVACCFDVLLVWTGLNRAMEVGSVYNVDVFSMAHTGVKNAAVWSSFASLVRNVLGLQISVFVYYTLVWYFRFVFMSCTWVFFSICSVYVCCFYGIINNNNNFNLSFYPPASLLPGSTHFKKGLIIIHVVTFHLGEECFQAVSGTGADNQTHNKQEKIHTKSQVVTKTYDKDTLVKKKHAKTRKT